MNKCKKCLDVDVPIYNNVCMRCFINPPKSWCKQSKCKKELDNDFYNGYCVKCYLENRMRMVAENYK